MSTCLQVVLLWQPGEPVTLGATCASSSNHGDNYKAHLQVLLDRINSINHADSTEWLSNVENNKDYKIIAIIGTAVFLYMVLMIVCSNFRYHRVAYEKPARSQQ